ncbi:hypothetical protein [Gordonia sp. 'Campus']|uniref:hypothetical protein n=1 Tax=Gordonia sp. 'Campus' TaxID=2915824 RepID=UPI001EE4D41C|nr:hypothetical protein [Gordonia sp. 'Campus']
MTMVRVLAADDLESAIELLASSLDDIPLYRWVLGEHIGDLALRRWLAEILVRPFVDAGCVVGAHRQKGLVGILVWRAHDVALSPEGKPPLVPADFAAVAAVPGLRERTIQLLTSTRLPPPAEDAVDLRIAAVMPEARGGSVLTELMGEVERFCVSALRPYYAWTGSERLRDWFVHEWGAAPFATENRNGLELYGVVSERPPRIRGQRTA